MLRGLTFALATALFVASAAVSALAAPPVADGVYDVQVWPGAQAGALVAIVSITLTETAALPATVRIPVIEGMQTQWAGEIGQSGAADVEREPRVIQGSSGAYAEFEVTSSRVAQVEYAGTLNSENGRFSASVRYVHTVPAKTVNFSVRLPSGASAPSIDPAPVGTPARNDAGEVLYTLPGAELAPGEAKVISASYSIGSPQAPRSGTPNTTTVLAALLAALALAAGLLALAARGRRSR